MSVYDMILPLRCVRSHGSEKKEVQSRNIQSIIFRRMLKYVTAVFTI